MSYFTQSLKLVCICPTSSLLSRLTTAQVLSSHRWLETTTPDSTGLDSPLIAGTQMLTAFFLRVLTSLRKCWVLLTFSQMNFRIIWGRRSWPVVLKNNACWFGIKFYVIYEIGRVNYSNLLFFVLLLHPLLFFWGGGIWRG